MIYLRLGRPNTTAAWREVAWILGPAEEAACGGCPAWISEMRLNEGGEGDCQPRHLQPDAPPNDLPVVPEDDHNELTVQEGLHSTQPAPKMHGIQIVFDTCSLLFFLSFAHQHFPSVCFLHVLACCVACSQGCRRLAASVA